MNKKKYEAPAMTEVLVELEQGFLKGSIFGPETEKQTGVQTDGHEIGGTVDFGDQGWDE